MNGARAGADTLYYLLPDVALSLALLAAAAHGRRETLVAAYALAADVFMPATLVALWTEGLAATPPGPALGFFACAVVIFLLLSPGKSPQS